LPESAAGVDVQSALGTSTVKATKVSDDVLKLQHYDTYRFKPIYDNSKSWTFQARVPNKIAKKMPGVFKVPPSSVDIASGVQGWSSPKSLLTVNQIHSKGGNTLIGISGLDYIFPKLGLGKPFTSLSKPYYYNIYKQKLGDTAKSVR